MRTSSERNVLFHEDWGSFFRCTFVLGDCIRCDMPAKPIRVQQYQYVFITVSSNRQRAIVIDSDDLSWSTR